MKAKHKEALAAYLFLTPNFIGFLIFTCLPVIFSLFLSFFRWELITGDGGLFSGLKFVGFANFIKLLGFHFETGHLVANDPHFWYYLYNTVFMMLIIPVGILGSLILALAVNQKLKGIAAYRLIFFLPVICPIAAIAVLWKVLLNPDFGLINNLISKFGIFMGLDIIGPNWLSDAMWAKPAVMLVSLWMTVGGYNMILYLAALQGIPRDLYEAADIDGASGWHKFRYITFPMISPTTFFITIMSIIGGLQGGFAIIYILTGGGPANSSTTIMYYIFTNLYEFQKAGYAAAVAWVLFIIIFVFSRLYWKRGGKLVHY
ncbi:MAG: sugar ABC transporter permease [Candidatus Saelkia tenebricola]|nr:sugar ABC transporter permease [Candidatus Saelkia tenebricola]